MTVWLIPALTGPGALVHLLAGEYERGKDPDLVAPGMSAFLTFFALALVLVVLGWSLTRRVRRSEYRNAQRRAQQSAGGAAPERAAGRGDDGETSVEAEVPDGGGSAGGGVDDGGTSAGGERADRGAQHPPRGGTTPGEHEEEAP